MIRLPRKLRTLLILVGVAAIVLAGRPTYVSVPGSAGIWARYPGFDVAAYRLSNSFGNDGLYLVFLRGNLPR